MLCRSKSLCLAAVLTVMLLHLCSEAQAASMYDCCLRYTGRKLHVRNIQGYDLQWASGGCDIDAIIFRTKSQKLVCADPKKQWVIKAVTTLSKRIKKT